MPKYCLLFGLFFHHGLSAQPIAVMVDRLNILYVGVPNPIQVVVSDLPMERLVLQASQGRLEATNSTNGQFEWILHGMIADKAYLILADSSLEHPIDTLFFRVKRLQEPIFRISGSARHGLGSVSGYFENYCSEYLKPAVLEYDITFVQTGQDPVVKHNIGAQFSGEAADYLRRVSPGGVVYFTNITWKGGFDATIRRSDQVLIFKPD